METASNVKCGTKRLTTVDSIEFKDVSFQYPNSNKQTLNNINFVVADTSCLVLYSCL